MNQKTFAERLDTIETKTNSQPKEIEQVTQSKENLSKREKILVSLRILESKGISAKNSYPRLYWGLHKIGVYPRPLHYKSVVSLFVMGALIVGLIFGGILASGIGADISKGPIAGLYRGGWLGVITMSLVSGVAFAVIIRGKAISSGIPRWSDIWQ